MKPLIAAFFLLLCLSANAQSILEWKEGYSIQLSDFQGKATKIGDVNYNRLTSGASFGFFVQMTNAEFMFTKNFNSKVNCSFDRSAAFLAATDSATAANLVNFAAYDFDLCELYARRIRKKLYEEKGAFSNFSFFIPIYEAMHKEYASKLSSDGEATNLGEDKDKLSALHKAVKEELTELADYCKSCKPAKKKK